MKPGLFRDKSCRVRRVDDPDDICIAPDNRLSARVLESIDSATEPHRAFASLWHAAGNHVLWMKDLDREASAFIEPFHRALREKEELPDVPIAAALAALDQFLGQSERPVEIRRSVRVPDGSLYHVVPRPNGWHSPYGEEKCDFREYWARRFHCIPAVQNGIAVRLAQQDPTSPLAFPFVAVAGGFEDGIKPDWHDREAHAPWRATELTNAEGRWKSVRGYLERARADQASVLVLPELTVDAAVLHETKKWLDSERPTHLALVAAGSFHKTCDGDYFNVAWLLDGQGRQLLEQRKLLPMRRKPGEDEGVLAGRELWLLATNLGLVAIGICLDFCVVPGTAVGALWPAIGPALVLVPSMAEESANVKHIQRAKDLYDQHGTRVLVASQPTGTNAKAKACGIVSGPESPTQRGEDPCALNPKGQGLSTTPQDRTARWKYTQRWPTLSLTVD